jgi:hypothetical protein
MGKPTPFTLIRGFSERSKEFDCKSNAISFVGSNPTSTTNKTQRNYQMKINNEPKLDFDDVLLVPQRSQDAPRV